jgi:broad specificity phosphatase PhoE
MKTQFLFVRHAQGTHNVSFCNDPRNFDALLTQVGDQQTLENKLNERFDMIFCSPLRRCRSTLLGIYPESEFLPVVLDDRLMELPSGINICDKRIDKKWMIIPSTWNSEKVSDITPWHSDVNADLERIKSFIQDVLANYAGKNILIVSHFNWINTWFRLYKNENVELDNCKSARAIIE